MWKQVHPEYLAHKSTNKRLLGQMNQAQGQQSWMDPIYEFLGLWVLLSNKKEAQNKT